MSESANSGQAAAGQGRRQGEGSAFWTYLLKRLGAALPVLVGVTFICYAILSAAPGDPVRILMGQHYQRAGESEAHRRFQEPVEHHCHGASHNRLRARRKTSPPTISRL